MTDAPMTTSASTATAEEVLSRYLTEQAGLFLRALPQAVGRRGPGPARCPR